MFVTTHVLIGGAAARRANGVAGAFARGLATHVLLDALPHWGIGSDWASVDSKRQTFLKVAAVDGLLCLGILAWVGRERDPKSLAGAVGGLLLDLNKPFEVIGQSPFPAAIDRGHAAVQRLEAPNLWFVDMIVAGLGLVWLLSSRPPMRKTTNRSYMHPREASRT